MARELSDKRSKLTAEERAALRERLAGRARRAESGIGRRPADAAPVLSFAQQRLWFLDQLEPGSDEYLVLFGLRLSGELDEGALRRALDGVVARHEPLRSSFGAERGEPRLVVHERVEVPWQIVESGGEAETRRLASEFARRPFDLAQAPLLRALLVREGAGE